MRTTVSEHDFVQAFQDYDRMEGWSRSGLFALYAWLEELDSEVELDVIAICCEFSECDTGLEAAKEYGFEPETDQDEDEREEAALDWLHDRTSVITFDGGVIVAGF